MKSQEFILRNSSTLLFDYIALIDYNVDKIVITRVKTRRRHEDWKIIFNFKFIKNKKKKLKV